MHRSHFAAAAVLLALLAILCTPAPARAQDTSAPPGVRVVGLRITAGAYKDSDQMRPFNYPPGTMVVLQVRYPGGGIYGIDTGGSTLQYLRDDTGTNLLDGDSSLFRTGLQSELRISKDGKAALVSLFGPRRPAEKARAIEFSGTVHLLRCSGTRTVQQKDVKLQKGTSFSLGGSTFTVVGTQRSFGQVVVELKTDLRPERLASLTFLNAGREDITGSTLSHQGGVIKRSLKPGSGVEGLTVRMKLRQGVETVKVSVDRTISVGL